MIDKENNDSDRPRFASIAVVKLALVALCCVGALVWLAFRHHRIRHLERNAPEVILSYQEIFREIRLSPHRAYALPNALVDEMVRDRLQRELALSPEEWAHLFRVTLPKIAQSAKRPIEERLGAAFASGDYDGCLKLGEAVPEALSVRALQGMSDACLAQFAHERSSTMADKAIQFRAEALRQVDEQDRDGIPWAKAAMALAGTMSKDARGSQAVLLLQRAHRMIEGHLGKDHHLTLKVTLALGTAQSRLGDYPAASPLLESVVEACDRLLEPDDSERLEAIYELAFLHARLGERERAVTALEDVLERRERLLGTDHPDSLMTVDLLAQSHFKSPDTEEARLITRTASEAVEEAEQSRERLRRSPLHRLQSDNPTKKPPTNVNGLDQLRLEIYSAASPYAKRAAEARERVLGPEHPDTLISLHLCALLEYMALNFEESLPIFERTLEACERVLGTEHTLTRKTIYDFVTLLTHYAKYEQALPLSLREMETWKRTSGDFHPNTLNAMYRLATIYSKSGEPEQAVPLLVHVIQVRRRVLGRDHPLTIETSRILTEVYMKIPIRNLESQSDELPLRP